MLVFCIVSINYLFYSSSAIELFIHKSVTEIRENYSGYGRYTYLFKNDEYENLIDDSINWNGTPFIKQELYNTIDSLKNTLVTVKQSSSCDCKIIQAKIIDPNVMLLENLDIGTYFYAEKHLIEYKNTKPNYSSITLTFDFGDKNYNGTLSYLIKGITWLGNYDLSITDSTCNLQGYAVIHNKQQQEYEVNNTYLFSGDLQLVKSFSSSSIFLTSITGGIPEYNSSSQTIQFNGEEKRFYSYSLQTPYRLRSFTIY